MKKWIHGAVWMMILMLAAITATAQVPDLINYQGKLVQGTNLYNGTLSIMFRLFDVPTGGAIPLYVDSNTVPVVDGLYSTYIGDHGIFGSFDVALAGTSVWVEVVLAGTNVVTPRERLVAAPYAQVAAGVEAAGIQTHMIGTGQIYDYHILNGQISGAKLANFTISNQNLAFGSVSASVIADGNVTAAKIQDAAITAAKVATNTFWQTQGNRGTTAGAHFVGTLDNQPLDLVAGSQRVFRLLGDYSAPNIIGGQASNTVNPLAAGGTVSGGGGLWYEQPNRVTDNFGTIGGGKDNQAGNDAGNVFDAELATVGGGEHNQALATAATVAGGLSNQAAGVYSVVGGGLLNSIEPTANSAAILGGYANEVDQGASRAVIAGGQNNQVRTNALYAAVAGGRYNTIFEETMSAAIGGGEYNTIRRASFFAAVGGGLNNAIGANSTNAVIAGGGHHAIADAAPAAVISGGLSNRIGVASRFATIGGGFDNIIETNATSATIAGGYNNTVHDNNSGAAVSGGSWHEIGHSADHAVIAGGLDNYIGARAEKSVVGGGEENTIGTNSTHATVGGGYGNDIRANSKYATISGGQSGAISTNSSYSVIAGGHSCYIGQGSEACVIGGGWSHFINRDCYGSVIAGGLQNLIYASGAAIGGGGGRMYTNEFGIVHEYRPNVIRADMGVIGGGGNNVIAAGATNAVIGGGLLNVVNTNAAHAAIPGGREALAGHYGQQAFASGCFSNRGDAQSSLFVLRTTTASEKTWEDTYLDGNSQMITVAPGDAVAFEALVIGRSDAGETAAYRIEGAAAGASGSTTAWYTLSVIHEDDSVWDARINGSLVDQNVRFQVLGNTETIRWVISVRTAEVGW